MPEKFNGPPPRWQKEFSKKPLQPKKGTAILLPEVFRAVSPVALAGLLIAARMLLGALGLPCPSVEAILVATGATRSRAYEVSAALIAQLPSLLAPRGRPPKAPSAPSHDAATLTGAVLDYVLAHPGCAHREDERHHYSDAFRHFVLGLRGAHPALDTEVFAAAVQIPLGTVKDWLRAPLTVSPSEPAPPSPQVVADSLHCQTVLDAWGRWQGTFLGFCSHVREQLHVPFGRSLVRRVLEAHGVRRTSRRVGRTPDESALRGAFKTYFPGAQWVGDGMQVPVVVDGTRFTFNLELDVDAHTGAFVGLSVRDHEDAAAVVEALDAGIASTSAPPLALLLDNRVLAASMRDGLGTAPVASPHEATDGTAEIHHGEMRAIRGQVDAWRRRRDRGRAMPAPLWEEAVDLAAEVGVYAAAQGIGVAYGSLRARLRARGAEAGVDERDATPSDFVDAGSVAELAPGSAVTTVEVALPTGERLMVRARTGAEAVVATALLRELRGSDR